MYNITSKSIIDGYKVNVKRLISYTVIIAQRIGGTKMLNWYAEQHMNEHNKRIKKALEDYAVREALAANHKPVLRTRTLFWVGDHMVRWGRKLQAQENSNVQPFGIYSNAHR